MQSDIGQSLLKPSCQSEYGKEHAWAARVMAGRFIKALRSGEPAQA